MDYTYVWKLQFIVGYCNTAMSVMYIYDINPKQNSGNFKTCVTSTSVSDTEEGAKYVP